MFKTVYRSLATPALAVFGALLIAPSAAHAKAMGSVVVNRVETRSTDFGREVVIHTSKEPTFSVFRLSDPFRVLVDVNDARLDHPLEMLKARDGVLRYVSTTEFADETTAILRVEIALEAPAPYSVQPSGNSIVVLIGSDQKKLDDPQVQSTTKPLSAVPSTIERVEFGQFGFVKKGGAITAPIKSGKLAEQSVKIEELEHPSRLVVDIANATVDPKWQRLNVNLLGIARARVATSENNVRIVLDAKANQPLPKIDVVEENGKLKIALAEHKAGPQPVAEMKPVEEPAPEQPKKQVAPIEVAKKEEAAEIQREAPKPATSETRVDDITFEPKDGFMRLTVFFNGEVEAVDQKVIDGGAPAVRIPHASLPKTLERTLDVTEVAGSVVSGITTYNHQGDVIITASILEGTEHRHWSKGNRLMWDFRNPRAATVIQYPEEATAAFPAEGTIALQTASGFAPQARRYTGRRISLDLKDAEIQNVLRLLADVSKLNIVASDDVKGRVTIKLRNVPWDQALDIVLRSKQLDKVRSGNIIRVAPVEVLRKEEELRLERQKARIELEPLAVRLVPVSYAVANEVKPQVTALLSPRGKVNIDARTNVLIVEDIPEVLLKVERLIRTLDTQTPQVLIESRIVEARANFSRQLGIQWGGQVNATQQYGTQTGLTFPADIRISGAADDAQNNVTEGVLSNPNYAVNLPAVVGSGGGGALGFIFGSVGGAALINLRLSAAESTGKVKLISAPKIVTLDNKEAKILSGERIPITVITANGPTTRFIDANLELNVTPHVTQDGSILLKIAATNNTLSNRVDLLGVPGILTNEANTEMIVGDGDTAVLGGIYQRNTQENEAYVPWIGQIPVLGWIFKTTRRSDARDELLIFISPRIINRSAALVQAG
jgi:type IV pilus assembly protein PilQ